MPGNKVLLIHSNTTEGSTTFVDSSLSEHTVTAFGDAHHTTSVAKFGTSSIYFDGVGDYITTPDSTDFTFGLGEWTIDFWLRRKTIGVRTFPLGQVTSGGDSTGISLRMEFTAANGISLYFGNTDHVTGYTLTDTITFHHFAIVRDGNTVRFFVDGIEEYSVSFAGSLVDSTASWSFGRQGDYNGFYFDGWMDEIRFIKGEALWVSNFTPPTSADSADNTIRTLINQLYGDFLAPKSTIVDLTYSLLFQWLAHIDQIYGLKLAAIINMHYGDSSVLQTALRQYYGDCGKIIKTNISLYEDMLQLKSIVDQKWTLLFKTIKVAEQPYSTAGVINVSINDQNYSLLEFIQLKKTLDQIYLFAIGGGVQQTPILSAITDEGLILHPSHVTIDVDETDFAMRGEIHIPLEDEYLQCKHMKTQVQLAINGTDFTLVVDSPRKSRPDSSGTEYYIPLSSPAVKLDFPYAVALEEEFEPAMASHIVEQLAAIQSINIQWDLIDWYIPANTLYVIGESPLDAIRKIVEAVRGVLQSDPDGTLVCRPEYPISVNLWQNSAPEVYLTDMENFFSIDTVPDIRDGFNKFFISNESTQDEGLRIEEEKVSSTTKIIKVFQIPWDDSVKIILGTSGGSWVETINEGVMEEEIEDETVEIIAGSGDTQYPIYGAGEVKYPPYTFIPSANRKFLYRDAGAITPTEDGYLTTADQVNTRVKLSYVTKYYKFRVTSTKIEEVQFYPKEV